MPPAPASGSSTASPAVPLTDAERHVLYRRTLMVVVISQVFGGAGLAAGVTVGALLAQDMLGGERVAGLPAALFTLGSALAAFTVGRLSQRAGRRPGLAAGFGAGAAGAAGIVVAAVADSPLLLFVSLFVYGSGTATNLQARYAGTDLAGMILFAFLRPDPYLVSLRGAPPAARDATGVAARATRFARPVPGVVAGATVMVLTQVAMVAIMTMTPVHMRHHHHGLGPIGFVISMHIAGMFLPSLLTGRLVDRLGPLTMAAAAAGTLLAAGMVAAVAPGDSTTGLTVALVLLGLGWNAGLISGTTLIVDSTEVATRARTQGSADVLIAVAGGGAISGLVVDAAGYAVLSVGVGLLALLLVPVLISQGGRVTAPAGPR